MKSLVFAYTNKEGEENISIGNYPYYKRVKESIKQLIRVFNLEHDEERWYNFTELEIQDRIVVLMQLKENNLHTYYIN